MIEIATVLSTLPKMPRPTRRALLALAGATAVAGCATARPWPGPPPPPSPIDGAFMMRDGARLPYRTWFPSGATQMVVLALHGFNDSRDAWEVPAATLTQAGFAIYGPDQRGFGDAPGRGEWLGTATMVADAAEMANQIAARHPGVPLVLMGESMGGAVLMCLAPAGLRPGAPAMCWWRRRCGAATR